MHRIPPEVARCLKQRCLSITAPAHGHFAYATSTLSKGGRQKREKLYQIENLRCRIDDKQGLKESNNK